MSVAVEPTLSNRTELPIDHTAPRPAQQQLKSKLLFPVKFTLTVAGVATMQVDQRAIYKLIFLDKRAQALCGSGADGFLRFWNVKEGECVWEQPARHGAGEAVVALATDPANRFLFSGDSAGCIKVWDISRFVNVRGNFFTERLKRRVKRVCGMLDMKRPLV